MAIANWFRKVMKGSGHAEAKNSRRCLRLVALEDRTAPAVISLLDPGFESPVLGAGNFRYGPASAAWTFTGSAGITGNSSGFTSGNQNAPQGNQVGFVQGLGSIRFATNLPAGTYDISFSAAQRGNIPSAETLQVFVDGSSIGAFNSIQGA